MQATDNLSAKTWELCVLTVIMVVATCARFYSLDKLGLSASELSSLVVCDASDWLAMARQYTGTSGLPPAYPLLLCQFTEWTSNAEFFVRALSCITGVASVYVVYLLGKCFFSPASGLLAAAVVATNFQAILLDRTATLYPLLAFGMLVHSYCFCRLLMMRDDASGRKITASASGDRWSLQWHWQPAFACEARFLLGFWASGVLVFYTSTISLALLIAEFVASWFLVAASHRRQVLKSMWLPLLITMLPWLPTMAGFYKWILQGNLLGTPPSVLDNLQWLVPVFYPGIKKIVTALIVVLFVVIAVQKIKQQQSQPQILFLVSAMFQLLAAIACALFIVASSPESYAYFRKLTTILLVYPVVLLITFIPWTIWRNIFIVMAVVSIMILQTNSNYRFKLYDRAGESGFALVEKIVSEDQRFMAGKKEIFSNSVLFDYYFLKYGVTEKSSTLLSEEKANILRYMANDHGFYYLEFSGSDETFSHEYPVYLALSKQYKVVCLTKLPWIRVTKFSTDAAMNEDQVVDCRSYSSGANRLQ
ncbi:MAG TPA: glycosyltransferase family 39 protein [Pseudomonadales bacterium]|nr:glycosyltransferase family 39 protein [Pseudomonadales bacterium]